VDGRAILLGNSRFMSESGVEAAALDAAAAELAAQGRTPMFVGVDGKAAGLVAVADVLKESSASAIERLHAMGLRPS